mgnify:CR=1 FL=1|jgi:hypothetical protein
MKYLTFDPLTNEATNFFDNEADAHTTSYAYPYDPATELLATLKLIDGEVVHTMLGKTLAQQLAQYNSAKEADSLQKYKESKIPLIKHKAAEKIMALDWQLERAKEQDQLENTTSKTLAVLQARQAIRDANNALEAEILACETREEIDAIDIKNF